MEILNHPLCNSVIGAPSDMQDDCNSLPVHVLRDEHGAWSVSFWKPGQEELAILNSGGSVALHVRATGRQHPVVGIAAQPV